MIYVYIYIYRGETYIEGRHIYIYIHTFATGRSLHGGFVVTTQRATLTPCQEPRGVPASRGTNWSLCCDVGFFGRSFQRKLRLRGIFFQVGRAYTHTLSAYYIYLEPNWPVVLVGKGLVLWGWPSKIEVSWVLFPSQFGPPRPTSNPIDPLFWLEKTLVLEGENTHQK